MMKKMVVILINAMRGLLMSCPALMQRPRVLEVPARAILLIWSHSLISIEVRRLMVHLRHLVDYPEEIDICRLLKEFSEVSVVCQ